LALASVQNRLFLVITSMALLASVSIGAVYIATQAERVDVRADLRDVASLYEMTVLLSNAIRDQEAGVDDYLLSESPAAAERFRLGVENELRIAERMREVAVDLPEYPDIQPAIDALTGESATWRENFGQRAIAAVDHHSQLEMSNLVAMVTTDQEPTLAGVGALLARIADAQTSAETRDDALIRVRSLAVAAGLAVMFLAATASLVLARRWVTGPLGRLLATANQVESGAIVAFKTERDDEIGRLGQALERMRIALQGDVDRSNVLNRFTEVTTFAADDAAVARANLEALRLLVQPDAGVTHVLNPSKDRAVPEASIGDAIAEILPLNAMSRCPAIVRGSLHVTPDAAEALSVHCPIYPTDHGTLACIPLAHGDTVGAVHLFWERPNAFGIEMRSSVSRLAEHAALAITNRRLLLALQGQASTDARTGLANTRAFDQLLEDGLKARRDGETIAILMLDLDHFKEFNDRYGHPSGDQALRTFADVLRSCLRDGDVASRYGGEEFAVALYGADVDTAIAVAERIRERTESTHISLAPGVTAQMTVSIGIASAPNEARDRLSLLRLADESLYRAKQAGRNRVGSSGDQREADVA
jgi:diguanylate cyclase (GGDEF)-like protein